MAHHGWVAAAMRRPVSPPVRMGRGSLVHAAHVISESSLGWLRHHERWLGIRVGHQLGL